MVSTPGPGAYNVPERGPGKIAYVPPERRRPSSAFATRTKRSGGYQANKEGTPGPGSYESKRPQSARRTLGGDSAFRNRAEARVGGGGVAALESGECPRVAREELEILEVDLDRARVAALLGEERAEPRVELGLAARRVELGERRGDGVCVHRAESCCVSCCFLLYVCASACVSVL